MLICIVPTPITDFSIAKLNGRRKNRIVVSLNPDPRIGDFWFESSVRNNWPSQWHSRYRNGYIRFGNRKRFDIKTESVEGKRVYLFNYYDVWIYFESASALKRLMSLADQLSDKDLLALTTLVLKTIDPKAQINRYLTARIWAEQRLAQLLPGLGLPQLREFTAMLEAGTPQRMQNAA